MHIPDGFVETPVAAAAGVVAVAGVALAIKKVPTELDERRAPLAGLVAAFVFAVQMLNFPVAAGTSGHLLGGVLAAVLVGPWTGMLCISLVLLVQGLVFADGGLSALGLNIVNMGLIGAVGGYWVFRAIRGVLPAIRAMVVVASGVAAGISVVMASIGFWVEYAIGGSTDVPLGTVFAAMVGTHALIGVGEGLITALTVGAVLAVRPDLVYGAQDLMPQLVVSPTGVMEAGRELMEPTTQGTQSVPRKRMDRKNLVLFILGGLIVALGLAFFVSPYASGSPDGLNKVAIDEGFSDAETEHATADSPLAGYGVEGVDDGSLSTGLAGVVGVAITFGLAMILFGLLRSRRPTAEAAPPAT